MFLYLLIIPTTCCMNGVQRIITEKTFLNAIWIFTGMKHPNTA